MPNLKRNLIYNTSYQVLILIVPFITSPYVSRVLGPKGIGTYSVTTAIAKYFVIFALLGMTNYGNRIIAKSRENKKTLSIAFWNLYFFQLITSSIVLGLYIFYAISMGSTAYGIISYCQVPYILSTVFEISWFFYGLEVFKGIVLRNAIVKILTTIAIFTFVKAGSDVWIYVLINALSFLMGQLCLWPFLKKYVSFEKPQWNIVKSHFKPNCILMVSVLAVSIYTLLDKIMLEWLSSTTDVGYYESIEKVLTIANNAAGAIGAVMLPRVSNLHSEGKSRQMVRYIDKSMNYIMLLAIALAFGIAGISKSFSVLYYGREFEKCGTLLIAIAPAIIFYAWSNILRNQYLLPNNKDSIFVIATISASIVNLILNAVLIPVWGALGAVIGTIGAQFSELIYQSYRVRNELPLKKYFLRLIPYITFGIVMFVVCKLIEIHMNISARTLVTQIVAGTTLFLFMVTTYLYINKDDMILCLIDRFRH